jgi:hypothetical protein
MANLLDYKSELYHRSSFGADASDIFPEESFFEIVSEMLSEIGHLDNVVYCPYRNTNKGMRIDGYSWNNLEKTLCAVVVNFTNDPSTIDTLTQAQIRDGSKRVSRFLERINDDLFIASMEVTDPGRAAALEMRDYLDEVLKFRIVFLTDQQLSTRVKKIESEKILNIDTSVEIWDLERLKDLDSSGADFEEFTVDIESFGSAINALPANISESGISTYLAIMPGHLLSEIYSEYGQRLLESNVRTFLDFRASTNKGMRKALLVEPENFFAYNNGLTVTSTGLKTRSVNGHLEITHIENMQIVNGGQTTAAIYFSGKDKNGSIKTTDGDLFFKNIDLNKVNVQMKLTVIEERETADIMKANIAIFANSQNAIQQSDLVSNHPFHLNIEKRSRNQIVPANYSGLPSKWFYERVRGQYSTQLRALSAQGQKRFITEYPKAQIFNKTDMSKYENTWRMKPHIVKKGAQANLKELGTVIIQEFEKNEDAFGASFYKDLVSKMILFRQADLAILSSDWYKQERGLKAEIVTYSISLLRHKLKEHGQDINLDKIYNHQSLSTSIAYLLTSLARKIRESISDPVFTNGVQNPSEFCKSERGWKKIQDLDADLSLLDKSDVLSLGQATEAKIEKREIDKAAKSINHIDYLMSISEDEWRAISSFFSNNYSTNHKNVGIANSFANTYRGKMPSDAQLRLCKPIRDEAYENGFDFL